MKNYITRKSTCATSPVRHRMSHIIKEIIDRKEAIKKAISLAQEGDIVIITGKGSESTMMVAHGQKIPFDDRAVAREMLKSL